MPKKGVIKEGGLELGCGKLKARAGIGNRSN
jgi:hypothetical protein